MAERTKAQRVGQWLSNVGQFFTNIKMLIAVLPIFGFSLGFFQHDNIKEVVNKTDPVQPSIQQPIIENTAYTPPAPVKDYDIVIKEILAVSRLQDKKIKQLSDKITPLEKRADTIEGRFNALKTWVGWNE